MHIDLTERLVILSRAVAPKGVDLVAHRHRCVVDPAGPALQVHWPAQHSARKPGVLSSSLCWIPSSQRGWPWWRKQREVQRPACERGNLRVSWGEPLTPGWWSSCSSVCWQPQKPPHYLSWADIFRGDLCPPLFFIYVSCPMCTLLWGWSKYRTVSVSKHHITDQHSLQILIYFFFKNDSFFCLAMELAR